MVVCFVSYWGIKDGLTSATVLPHLAILSEFDAIEAVHLITVERENNKGVDLSHIPKLTHHSIKSGKSSLRKVKDRAIASRIIRDIHQQHHVDWIIARTTLAGWLIQKIAIKANIPFTVESYEPHADYMVEDGVWKKDHLKYRIAREAEIKQLEKAQFILPVSERYAQELKQQFENLNDKIVTMPCCVDSEKFAFNIQSREELRAKLGIDDRNVVGIYTGKLGGIYLDQEAINLVRQCVDHFGDSFRLIVLTPQRDIWRAELLRAGIADHQFVIDLVPLNKVPHYLSASDFAFSLHRPTPSKIAITPIKNAEYLANGLPTVIPTGIGEDSDQIREHNLGIVLSDDLTLTASDFERLEQLILEKRTPARYLNWVKKNRSFQIVRDNYRMILNAKI